MSRSLRQPWRSQKGFTLIELMVVIVVLGILATLGVQNFLRYQRNAKIAATASELRSLSAAFVAYKAAYGDYPPDSHLALPPGMEEFIDPQLWVDETPIGGNYNWEGPSNYPYAGLSVFGSTSPQWMIDTLDNMLDDGDLATGRFRTGTNGRPTLIIEE